MSMLSLALILFAPDAPAGAAKVLQKGTKDKVAHHDILLSNIKRYCDATLGPGYSLSVQKTYNGGYLFICSRVGDENGKDISYPQPVRNGSQAN